MNLRPRFGMGTQKVMQYMQQGPDMVSITLGLGLSDVIDDHAADLFGAMILVGQVGGISGRRDFRHVFMLGNRQNLFFRQVAKTDAVLERNHDAI